MILNSWIIPLLVLDICIITTAQDLVIQTNKGAVKGTTVVADNGKEVDVWNSIPYAQPPTEDLRFKHPIPAQNWNGVKDTTKLPNNCFQPMEKYFYPTAADREKMNATLSEDCLYLTVTVPKPRPTNASVMFFIYAGGFYTGNTRIYEYKILASEENVIIVAPQYRVSVLGFLSMGNITGNAGLFDQLMALQWVQDNIENFGGNKHSVTLYGISAGGGSIGMHLLSPLSRNLFSRGILESGSPLDRWASASKEKNLARGFQLAEHLGCSTGLPTDEIINCLRTKSPSELVQIDLYGLGLCEFPFVPIADGIFFKDSFLELLNRKDFKNTSILLGASKDEGNFFLMHYFQDLFKKVEDLKISEQEFQYVVDEVYKDYSNISRMAIKYEYTPWQDVTNGYLNRNSLNKLIGDQYFLCGNIEFADYFANAQNKVYTFYSIHRSSQDTRPEWVGATHGSEGPFMAGIPLKKQNNFTSAEIVYSKRLMNYWANFARTGDPNLRSDGTHVSISWPARTPLGREYLTIAPGETTVGQGPRAKECAFWRKFIIKLEKCADQNYQNCI